MLNIFIDRPKDFRNQIYNSFRYRADTLFNLMDALAVLLLTFCPKGIMFEAGSQVLYSEGLQHGRQIEE